jgi:hypothetical protein
MIFGLSKFLSRSPLEKKLKVQVSRSLNSLLHKTSSSSCNYSLTFLAGGRFKPSNSFWVLDRGKAFGENL